MLVRTTYGIGWFNVGNHAPKKICEPHLQSSATAGGSDPGKM